MPLVDIWSTFCIAKIVHMKKKKHLLTIARCTINPLIYSLFKQQNSFDLTDIMSNSNADRHEECDDGKQGE